MTQPRAKMRYPKGRIILVRDCTVAICLNNNPGAVLLSTLLFWYDNPHKFDTCQGDDFTMCRTQASIEEQACHQIDVKTIHDTAVPLLQLLGYLSVVEKMNGNLYTLHMDRILAGYAAYENGPDCLKAYLKASMQLESTPIVMAPSELESTLINKHWLYFEIERVLIANRAGSNCKRGRKPKQKAASDSQNANTETIRDSIETLDKEREGAFAPTRTNETSYHIAADAIRNDGEEDAVLTERFPDGNLRIYRKSGKPIGELIPIGTDTSEGLGELITVEGSIEEDAPTVKMPAIKIGASHADIVVRANVPSGSDRGNTSSLRGSIPDRPLEQTPGPGALPSSAETPHLGRSDGITRDQASLSVSVAPPPAQSSPPTGSVASDATRTAQATGKPEKPKRGRKNEVLELPAEVVQFLDAWDSLHRAPLPRTDRLIALAKAGVQAKVTREELEGCRNWLPTTDRPGKPYYRHKGVGLWDVIDKIGEYRSLQNMPIPGVPLADMKRPAKAPGTTGFDIYKGNGPEEREAVYQEALARLANGTLIE